MNNDLTDDDNNNPFISTTHKKSSSSRSITFRLDSFVLDELQRDADENDISLNVFVSKILRRYIEWDRYEQKLKMMPVPKILISSLINEIMVLAESNGIIIEPYREKLIKYSAEIAFSNIKDCVLFMKKKFDLWSVLSVLEDYMKVSAITSDHRIESERKHIFVIQHDLGEYWSLFTKELFTIIFNNLANVRVKISATKNSVIAEVHI